ncbi:MAG: nuclear transport factor 2 family protein [Gemmatimonadota bacterium]|nr:nuclear transport factor 2 family protein [Gemmatimonadota bacterium]MDH4348477.1 nuclear transport factor 2 family protein [Gemmatimonadota bacterium]MDH5283282.1 nuclear transport factor 2 family protein [Gemmatimonadota bacterium]
MRLSRTPSNLLVLFSLLMAAPEVVSAQSPADSAGIRRAALDYAEGWYEGDATRMERALHPDLAKRIARTDSTGASRLQQMTAAQLIDAVGRGGGRSTPADKQLKDVVILDIFGSAASARVTMSGWVDYLHLAKWNGEWRIVNVLWELKPRP